LFQSFAGEDNSCKVSVVSHYALRMLSDMMSVSFIKKAKSVMPNNPSFQGWILEMEVLGKIKAKDVNLSNRANDSSELWNCWNDFLYFADPDEIRNRSFGDMTLLVPTKYNHGLFDIMLYVKEGHIIIANVTGAKQHLFNMELILPYVEIFKRDKVCIVDMEILIPASNNEKYKITVAHLQNKRSLWKYDDRWKPNQETLLDCCKVRLYSPDSFHTANRHSNDFVALAGFEPHGMITRKRARDLEVLEEEEFECSFGEEVEFF